MFAAFDDFTPADREEQRARLQSRASTGGSEGPRSRLQSRVSIGGSAFGSAGDGAAAEGQEWEGEAGASVREIGGGQGVAGRDEPLALQEVALEDQIYGIQDVFDAVAAAPHGMVPMLQPSAHPARVSNDSARSRPGRSSCEEARDSTELLRQRARDYASSAVEQANLRASEGPDGRAESRLRGRRVNSLDIRRLPQVCACVCARAFVRACVRACLARELACVAIHPPTHVQECRL